MNAMHVEMSAAPSIPARLALADGTVFSGTSFGARHDAVGEVVFNTALSGYQEVLTDPSYHGQLVTMTAPHIGNVGWNATDDESAAPRAAGMIVRELSPVPSSWRSTASLHGRLEAAGVPGIAGVDTRALTRLLREHGALSAVLSVAPEAERSDEELVAQARSWGGMQGRDLVSEVTCAAPYPWDEPSLELTGARRPAPAVRGHVVVYDYGVKRNLLRKLRDVGFRLTVVPALFPAQAALALGPDGFLLTNGPGDPAALPRAAGIVAELLDSKKPIFGVCMGHQILGLALGATTYKLKFGHHGINHPVKDLRTGRVEITSQNHGFAVDVAGIAERARLTHVNLNDGTVEGLEVRDRPAFSVQYHPEAAPGPHDAGYLFERFAGHISGDLPERAPSAGPTSAPPASAGRAADGDR